MGKMIRICHFLIQKKRQDRLNRFQFKPKSIHFRRILPILQLLMIHSIILIFFPEKRHFFIQFLALFSQSLPLISTFPIFSFVLFFFSPSPSYPFYYLLLFYHRSSSLDISISQRCLFHYFW